ncbi:MAG: rod shape-determining protein MreD [Chloroflexota bacterium]|nr:rod shape-determining protein MreD [Chloroflexota bacterium]
MSLPLAAAGAVATALLETSVFSELKIAGVKPDLVFVFAVVSAIVAGVETGLLWAFLGGLMLDMMLPERPVGSTTLVLLLSVGAAVLAARLLPESRVAVPTLAVFVLTWAYQLVTAALLSVTAAALAIPSPLPSILPIAVLNAAIALPAALVARSLAMRRRPHDRLEF